jgi:protein ImuB
MFACLYKPENGVRPHFSSDAEKENMGSGPIFGSRLLEVARLFSPRVDARSDTVITLEVDGLTRLFGDDKAVGEQLRRAAADAGLGPVHVGIAATRTTAILCAAARAGVTVVPAGEEAAILAPLPLRLLEVFLPNAESRVPRRSPSPSPRAEAGTPNPAVLPVLSRWGIRTLGQLAALPAVELSERIGQDGLAWRRLARGEDVGPLVPTREEDPFEATTELEWPIEGIEPLSFVLGGLLDPLCQRLERRDRGAAVLHLRLRLVTKDTHTRSLQLPAPMRDAKVLRTLLLLDLESHQPPAGVDCVTVAIDPTPGRIVQESLLARSLPAPEQVSTLLARLGALMGDTRCGSPALVDSHRPGAFAMVPFCVPEQQKEAPLGSSRSSVAGGRDESRPLDGSGRHGGRPLRRTTESRTPNPDSRLPRRSPSMSLRAKAGIPSACLRRFRLPIPARVLIDHDRPIVVNTDRPGLPGGRVHDCAGPWRTSGEWWKTAATQGVSGLEALRGLAGWNRDEWDVALSDGGRYRIFEDRESGRWFMEATVD